MFIITGRKNGIIWDFEKDKPLIKFTDGKAETADETVALKLHNMGYMVKGDILGDDHITKMKLNELKAYAAEKGIDLEGISGRKEIISKIRKVESSV